MYPKDEEGTVFAGVCRGGLPHLQPTGPCPIHWVPHPSHYAYTDPTSLPGRYPVLSQVLPGGGGYPSPVTGPTLGVPMDRVLPPPGNGVPPPGTEVPLSGTGGTPCLVMGYPHTRQSINRLRY